MATPSRRQSILTAFLERVSAITVENQYATDVGRRVFFGEGVELGEDDPPTALAIVVQDSQPQPRGGFLEVPVIVEFQALAKVDPEQVDQPYIAAEIILTDVQRAIEAGDRTLGGRIKGELQLGPTRVVPKQPGSTTVGVGVTYGGTYLRTWGQP